MKLRNKKTGEIVDFMIHKYVELSDDGNPVYGPFNGSIEDWEDYEEPKKYWYIYGDDTMSADDNNDFCANSMKSIGNYFKTKEEAENAVKKLKAWKRLKDKGFRLIGYGRFDVCGNRSPYISFVVPKFDDLFDDEELVADLNLLFGGEDE